jgi:hypothetical protein
MDGNGNTVRPGRIVQTVDGIGIIAVIVLSPQKAGVERREITKHFFTGQ